MQELKRAISAVLVVNAFICRYYSCATINMRTLAFSDNLKQYSTRRSIKKDKKARKSMCRL